MSELLSERDAVQCTYGSGGKVSSDNGLTSSSTGNSAKCESGSRGEHVCV